MANSPVFTDMRKFPRKNYDAMVSVFSRGEHTFESARQISEGGMLLQVERTLLIGDQVKVTFYIPGQNHPPCVGTVVYHLRAGLGERLVGIRFNEISDSLKQNLFL